MKITFLGLAGFKLQHNSSTLLIDPGTKQAGDVRGDIAYVTHTHFDHTRGVEIFLHRNPTAVLICNQQVAKRFSTWHERIIQVEPDDAMQQGPWNLRFIEGQHGLFSGVQNTGVIVQSSQMIFGHTGDSVDFTGFSHEDMDGLAIPICGIFTASPNKALTELARFKQPLPVIVPIHWFWRNPHGFCKRVTTTFPNSRCIVPKDGERVYL